MHSDFAFGESYIDGDLQIEPGDIDDLMALMVANREHWKNHWLARLVLALDTRLARFSGLKFLSQTMQNVAHHYDLKDSLFDNFLDPLRQYYCAYFRSLDEPLANAHITKLSRILANFGCSRVIMCWISAAAGAGWPLPLPRLNPRSGSPASPALKTSLRSPAL